MSDWDQLQKDVTELHAENQRLRKGLEMIAQIIHGSTRVTRMIADATLAGADLNDEDTAIEVCEGTWKPTAKK